VVENRQIIEVACFLGDEFCGVGIVSRPRFEIRVFHRQRSLRYCLSRSLLDDDGDELTSLLPLG
jgi:hypothetical protein